jgi:hypothetical protein
VVLAILASTFFYGLDNTAVADNQTTVAQGFSAIDRLSWICHVSDRSDIRELLL